VIVTCHQCATQFHLDDAKVPPEGIRVRCSRCKFAFMVESPQQAAVDHGEAVARETRANDPDVAESAGEKDPGESDWEFSVDIDSGAEDEGGDRDAAAAAVDDLLGGVTARGAAPEARPDPHVSREAAFDSSSASGFDADEAAAAYEIDTDSVGHDLGGADVDFAPPTDFDEVDLGGEIGSEPPDDVHADLSIATDSPGEGSEVPAAPPWQDADPIQTAAEPAVEEPPGDASIDGPGDRPRETDAAEAAESADPVTEQPPWAVEAPIDVGGPAPDNAPWWATFARAAAGWASVTGLCVAALALGLFPATPSALPEAAPRRIAGVEAHGLEGRWIDNSIAGPIYVVSGTLRPGADAPTAATALRVYLVDSHGDPVSAESAAIGPPVATRDLREASPRDLRERLERAAPRFAATPLAAADRRPFQAIFERIPPPAAAFVIRVAEDAFAQPPEQGFADLTRATAPTP